MKLEGTQMHSIIVKQGFAVIVAFVTTFVYKNPCNRDLVVGCEDYKQKNKLPLRGP